MKTLKNMRLRTKLILTFSCLMVVPLIIIGIVYYAASTYGILNIAEKNISYANQVSRKLTDQVLYAVEEDIAAINADADLFEVFLRDDYSTYEIQQQDIKVSGIINKYFKALRGANTINIVTPQFTYGSKTVVSAKNLFESRLLKSIAEQPRWVHWIPTHYIPEEFQIDYLRGISDQELYSFAAVVILNPVRINPVYTAEKQELPQGIVKPVLIIHFNPEFFLDAYGSSTNLPGSFNCVFDDADGLISMSEEGTGMEAALARWGQEVPRGGSGIVAAQDGGKLLVSHEVSEVTGWHMIAAVPMRALMADMVNLRNYVVVGEFLLVLLAVVIVSIISTGITKPIRRLTSALKRMGKGNFGEQLEPGSGESGYLIEKFNEMSTNIKVLIKENFEVKLREKESEIAALNTQLNPHLLYNTLNIINLEALDRNQPEISRMLITLSRMLQYTVFTHQEMASLEEDLAWLKSYEYIMSLRFEDLFQIDYQIEDAAYREAVPKLFLQPFLENAIVHGFKGIEGGGLIRVTGVAGEGRRIFTLTDNGRGIDAQRMEDIHAGRTGVGIHNVRERIRLIYGDAASLTIDAHAGFGTTVSIVLPDTAHAPT